MANVNRENLDRRVERAGLRRCRRRRRWYVLTVLLACGAWFAHFAYLRITRHPTPRTAYWEAQIARLDPPPRGAISSREAQDVLTDTSWVAGPPVRWGMSREVLRILHGAWDASRADVVAVTREFESAAFNDAREHLRLAVAAGWRDKIDLSVMPTSRYGSYMPWCKRLLAHARWSIEQRHDVETAVADWLDVVRLARQARRTSSLKDHLVEANCNNMLAREMANAASEVAGPVGSRALALEIDAVVGPVLSPRELLACERAHIRATLERIYVREGGDWLDVSAAAGQRFAAWGGPVVRPSRVWNLTAPLFHDFGTACARVEEALAALETADTIVAAGIAAADHRLPGPGCADGLWVRGAPPVSSRTSEMAAALRTYYQVRCQLDAAVTLLALHDYRCRHQRYPATLDELIPEYLARLPIDYADQRALRYRVTEDAFLLYSVGQNGRDDGGRCRHPNWLWDPSNADVLFSAVRREEH